MELRPNRIKRKLAAGDCAYIVSGITHPDDIDAFGPNGFDGIWLEGEHGWVTDAELGNLTRSMQIAFHIGGKTVGAFTFAWPDEYTAGKPT